MSFTMVEGLNLQQIRDEIDFPISLEKVFTEQDDKINKRAVTRFTAEGKKVLGLVSPKRKVIPYAQMMDWVVGEFNSLDLDFKLQESSLVKSSDNLFQQYLFDTDITNPDMQEISPMLILKGSHITTPLRIDIGTFRFVCSNGALVGNTIKSISLKANDLDGLLRFNLKDEIRHGIDDMRKVSARYGELHDDEMEPYMMEMFRSPFVPVALKKALMDCWVGNGTIMPIAMRTLKNNDFLTLKLDGNSVSNSEGALLFEMGNRRSAWDIYNDATEVSTHSSRNEHTRNSFYRSISNVFAA